MKKFYWILVCLFVLLPQFAITQTFGIAQTYSRLSHGFNTRKITEKNGEKDYEYFIIDNDRYSNVLIKESWEESHIGSGVRYEIPYTRDSYLIITLRDGGDMGYPNLHPKGTPIRSSYTEDMLIQNFKDGSTIRYYNTSEDEIEHLYLTLFVKHMSIIINNFHLAMIDLPYKNIRLLPWYEDVYFFKFLLPNFKENELGIIKNLLFARHHYAFPNNFWQEFMNKYYSENYNGLYTELEVMENFNWFELWLLDLIIQHENKYPTSPSDFLVQNIRAYEFHIGGKYNILQYRANIRKEPNINSDVIAILSVHDEIEILENTLVEEEINNFWASWYKIKYGNIVGYTFGGNIACRKVITDIDNNGINDYFYLRCYRYMHPNRTNINSSPYNRFLSNRDIVIYINNRRIRTNEIIGDNPYHYGHSNRYLFDRGVLINFRNYVLIQLTRYGWDSRNTEFYKVNSNGSIERVGGVSHQGFGN